MMTKMTGLSDVKYASAMTAMNITSVALSTMAFLKSLMTALRMRTQTQILMPAKAF